MNNTKYTVSKLLYYSFQCSWPILLLLIMKVDSMQLQVLLIVLLPIIGFVVGKNFWKYKNMHKEYLENCMKNEIQEHRKYLERQENINQNIEHYMSEQQARKLSKKWWKVWV